MSEKINYEITEGYDKEVLLEVLRNFDKTKPAYTVCI